MVPDIIKKWHNIVKSKNVDLLDDILAEDARMISPIVHTVQEGKEITKMYLTGAAFVLGNEHFRYIREVYDEGFALLEFETELDGIKVNGVDLISWNDSNQITEFKVMVRPLKGVNAVHQAMKKALESIH